MVADPEQMRFYPRSKSRDEVGVWLAWNLAFYEERGFGTWYLEPVFDSAFAGYFGLRPLLLAGRQEVELACHVKKAFLEPGIRHGGRTEIDAARLRPVRLSRLVAIIHPDNLASRRVAQKLGTAEERSLIHDGEPIVAYGIRRD